jgi:hypothetical protein
MRIGIFFQADDTDFANQVVDTLKQHELPGIAYKLGRTWEQLDGEEISFNFSSISHYVIIPTQSSFHSRWLPFIAGFGLGGVKTVCLVLKDPALPIPNYLKNAEMFSEMPLLVDFMRSEADIWDKTYQIEKAREALIALGLGINEENFAQRVGAGDEISVSNFLRIGYSPDTANAQGVPIICVATRNGHKKIVDLLLQRGADVNVLSLDRGNSPLMEAAVRGDDQSVRRFLEVGANPNLVSKSGQTALMLAIGEGHKEIVKVLLEYKADLSIKDSLGMTARKYADIFRHEEITALLEAFERQQGEN